MKYLLYLWSDYRTEKTICLAVSPSLKAYGIDTMGKIARCSIEDEELLYQLFGVNAELLIRRLNLTVNHVVDRTTAKKTEKPVELDLFTDYEAVRQQKEAEEEALQKEQLMQEVLLNIKQKYGKNAILRGLNFEETAKASQKD